MPTKPKISVCVDLNMKNPEVQQALESRLTQIKGINETLRGRLREQLRRGFALGETTDQIAERIRGEFRTQLYRARTIARTEINAAANDSRSLQAKKTFGNKFDKEWIDSNDLLVRPSHNIGGERVSADKRYSNGMWRPHDPSAPANELVNCYLPGTKVSGRFITGSKAWYSGEVCVIETRMGERLTVTINHPILTDKGWVPAHQLREGNYLLTHSNKIRDCSLLNENDKNGPVAIEDVFNALRTDGRSRFKKVSALDFHGDGSSIKSQIEIVDTTRVLLLRRHSESSKQRSNRSFVPTDVGQSFMAAFSSAQFGKRGVSVSTSCEPSVSHLSNNQFAVILDARPLNKFCFGLAAQWDTPFKESGKCSAVYIKPLGQFEHANSRQIELDDFLSINRFESNARFRTISQSGASFEEAQKSNVRATQLFTELQSASAGQVKPDDIIRIGRLKFDGHVYDLQTDTGYMLANNVLSSNCRCTEVYHPKDED